MATLVSDPAAYLRKHLDRKSRVLLINPPVEERRYHWLRWNQPVELLKLSSWLTRSFKGVDVRLFDFMLPDEHGQVPKHKVKETWRAPDDEQLWHFGQSFETFAKDFDRWALTDKWYPDVVIVSSLTSYWHVSIEKLLSKLCSRLGKTARRRVTICLYGNYPKFEPEHAAERQRDADIAFTETLNAPGILPDHRLYLTSYGRGPLYYGLDINAPDIASHLQTCLDVQAAWQAKRQGAARPPTITVAFLNDDVCGPSSRLEDVVRFAVEHPRQLTIEGIVGIEPRSLTRDNLHRLKAAGFRSLFVEHARLPGGDVDEEAYQPLLAVLRDEEHAKQTGKTPIAWLDRGNVTGFVAMGLPDDEIESLVRSTLRMNSYFQSVILKPFGYSPSITKMTAKERRSRWEQPALSSPQRFPFVGKGTLHFEDYDNLIRWQNVLNKRVKGATFDFLGHTTVARLVRETVVAESWKRRREAR